MPDSNEQAVELFYGYKKYQIKKSETADPHNKVVLLPDGIALDLTQTYVDTTDKHGNALKCPRLRGHNSEYEISGELPVVGVIKAEATE